MDARQEGSWCSGGRYHAPPGKISRGFGLYQKCTDGLGVKRDSVKAEKTPDLHSENKVKPSVRWEQTVLLTAAVQRAALRQDTEKWTILEEGKV